MRDRLQGRIERNFFLAHMNTVNCVIGLDYLRILHDLHFDLSIAGITWIDHWMAKNDLPSIAVIADAHFHDIESYYDCDGIKIDGRQLTLRTWADTRRSSRVFNESKAALMLALKDIEDRGIKHVVLLGDYSDDGQIEASERLVNLLRLHRKQHGTRFFAITGNHDAYGPLGKHQSTRFVSGAETTVLVSSDPDVAASEEASAVLTHKMYCEGVPDAISRMSEFGLFKQADYLHWETPFGTTDSISNRQYEARSADGLQSHKLVDASYLVEPVDGLWLLMIDANVFEPRNGQRTPAQKKAFLDSSDAGWNSVLRNRPYLMDWITAVCSRADKSGKTLMAFSHYPIIDPFADMHDGALGVFDKEMRRRKPLESVSAQLLNCGVRLHFSGHLHVNALTMRGKGTHVIEDCAVPSLAAFPACYKIVHADTDNLHIDTVHLASMTLDVSLMNYYREENRIMGDDPCAALATLNYGEFLYKRMHTRVMHHYLVRQWPEDIAQSVVKTNAADLALLMLSEPPDPHDKSLVHHSEAITSDQLDQLAPMMSLYRISLDNLVACSMTQLVSDWYCLRHAGYLARPFIESNNMRVYSCLADTFGNVALQDITTPKALFSVFLGMLQSAITRSDPSASRETILSVTV